MSSEDRWTVHGLLEGRAVRVECSDSFGGSFTFTATGFTPAVFDLAPVWAAVVRGASGAEVRSLLETLRRAGGS
jgi:hypothetical protein